MKNATRALLAAGFVFSIVAQERSEWAIHEWGTFTSLQDEKGNAIGGINTDDEPVPPFVHRLSHWILQLPTESPPMFFQGAPKCHPDVTMRLETPVIYFHPPTSPKQIHEANVSVKFRGGWLTEFYPKAIPHISGLDEGTFNFGPLNSDSVSELTWNNLKIGGDWPLATTSEHVWTSPRAVNAAVVQTPNGEAEKFLFYRGVAHLDSPLRVSRAGKNLEFRSQLGPLSSDHSLKVSASWLVNIRANGTMAFRPLPPFNFTSDEKKLLLETPADFRNGDFSANNLTKLNTELRNTLIAEGLFDDEADALLNTWELSYFKSSGLRVFYIVPRAWTDHHLPLQIDLAAKINRVMVGRVELVTPQQRNLLQQIAGFSPHAIKSDVEALVKKYYGEILRTGREPEAYTQVQRGLKPLSSFVSVPKTYQTYLKLGRFRNALILDEATRKPALTNFISTYRLEAHAGPLRADYLERAQSSNRAAPASN